MCPSLPKQQQDKARNLREQTKKDIKNKSTRDCSLGKIVIAKERAKISDLKEAIGQTARIQNSKNTMTYFNQTVCDQNGSQKR